ncbi:uncharacterized protein (DUF4415 family) [Bosea sp. BE125]|uniref:BrnA antitoxin family protein n=1 Tax=Bosea sp. BE125 TaxID=2817909 RepID=UPI00285D0137|nr:BrnA antitoxin family protein [Bosea sp. BE125]MDR6874561.1 uncharacterized protein (DUF4415 family) [Bosea sp. BE125]
MTAKKRVTQESSDAHDPDDAPELDDAFFARADLYEGDRLVRRGRPPLAEPKVSTTIRLSRNVLSHFKAGGPGWQTRIDEALAELIKKQA